MNRLSYTWSADGNSDTYRVRAAKNQGQIECVGITLGGTWGSGTATPMVSVDEGASFEPAETSPGTGATWSADAALYLELPSGAQFYFALSGSTSPDLDLNASGNITKV